MDSILSLRMDTTFDDHDPLAHDILQVIESFIDEIGQRNCTAHFDKVVDDKYRLKGKHLVQRPERFIEDHLVYPLLEEAFEYSVRPQPIQYAPRWPRSGVPDFCITSIPISTARANDIRLFGEVKKPKDIDNARKDMEEYLNSDLDVHAVVLLTDGFDWELWVRPKGTSVDISEKPNAQASLRSTLQTVRTRNMEMDTENAHAVRKAINTEDFEDFTCESLIEIVEGEFGITTEATDLAN